MFPAVTAIYFSKFWNSFVKEIPLRPLDGSRALLFEVGKYPGYRGEGFVWKASLV